MDKRRNHIIFWVGYYLWNAVGNYATTNGFRTISFTVISTIVTVLFLIITFYSFVIYVFPLTVIYKKYLTLLLLVFTIGGITQLCHYSIMKILAYYFPNTITDIYIKRIIPYFIIRYMSVLYIAFGYWSLNIYKENLKKKEMIQKRKNELTKSINQAELSSLINQINPHFLYNILNFFYAQSLPISTKLSSSILMLSNMMRYSIREKDEEGLVDLEKEIDYIKSYVTLNNIENKKNTMITFSVDGNLRYRRIKPLILLPFVNFFCNNRKGENVDLINIHVVENDLSVSVKYIFKKNASDINVNSFIVNYKQFLFKEYETDYNLSFQSTPILHTIKLNLIL